MKVADFDYDLPTELIAQFPASERVHSRLLHADGAGRLKDRKVADIGALLSPGDLLLLNDTKVIPARIFGKKDTGGRVEILMERIVAKHQFLAQLRSSRSPKVGQTIVVDSDNDVRLTMVGRQDSFFLLEISPLNGSKNIDLLNWFEKVGHIPLPPYIDRDDQSTDKSRYQTVYAQEFGAVAAPTAGLHYDEALLGAIKSKGVNVATVTLHVGAGTYQPVKVDSVAEHKMHSEWIAVNQAVCDAIIRTKKAGKRVIAVGTTVVRSLETAAQNSSNSLIEPYQGETDIFIYPGFDFKVVDVLQTNFHLPKSTLLMLVSAFASYQTTMQIYHHAIKEKYRFFSYGDSMLIEKPIV